MPNITQYTAENTKLNESGFEGTARRIGAFGSQEAAAVGGAASIITGNLPHAAGMLGQAVEQHIDYMDRGRVASAATAGLAKLQQDWQQTLKGTPDPNNPGQFINAADPNDQQVMARFQRDHVEPFLTDLQSLPIGINGGRYAQAKADELRQHLSTQFQADMSHLAGDAAVLNSTRVTNNLAASVSTDPSFHNVDFALKQSSDDMAHHFAGANITAEQESRLKIHQQDLETKIVHTAAASAIMQSGDPEGTAQSFIKKYPDYIKPDEAIQLAKQARSQIKFNESMDRATRADQDRIAGRDANASINEIRAGIIEGGNLSEGKRKLIEAFKNNKDGFAVHEGLLKETNDWIDGQAAKKRTVGDPKVEAEAAQGVYDGTWDERALAKAAIPGNGLSSALFGELYPMVQKMRELGVGHQEPFKASMNTVRELIKDQAGYSTPIGDALMAKFLTSFPREYTDRVKLKKDTENDLNMLDPKSLIRQRLDPMLEPFKKDLPRLQAFLDATGTKIEDHGGLWETLSKARAWFSSKSTPLEVATPDEARKLAPGTAYRRKGESEIRYVPYK